MCWVAASLCRECVVAKVVVLFVRMGYQGDIEGGGICCQWRCVRRSWDVVVGGAYDGGGRYLPL